MRKLIGLFALLTIWGLQVCFAQTPVTITGTVTDKDGEPMIGVTVRLKSKPTEGVTTNVNGEFAIKTESMNETLLFTYIGMKDKNVALKPGVTRYKVVMEDSQTDLGAVVVNAGIIQRDKAGFTGSVKMVTQEELKSVGNINVLQTLRSLDPSLDFTENTLMGSDPNTMPYITMRGGSTINITSTFDDMSVNPNQPLFILDGFETTLEVVNDLDINRIESVTLLKDASSTAIYGSKGGNGVFIIETVKPKPGEVRVNYNGTMNLELVDLSSYNLMNAAEKLDFELKAGRYKQEINHSDNGLARWLENKANIEDYYSRLENVKAGVNTYWLKVPIRTGITQDHSLSIDGGESAFLYQVGVRYRNVQGVMKDVYHQVFGGNMLLQYRTEKLNIRNNLTIDNTNGHTGSWGSFKDFAQANPYYKKQNDDGTIPVELDVLRKTAEFAAQRSYNPYWNANLKSKSDTRDFSATNNATVDWSILSNLRFYGTLQIATGLTETTNFKDARHTDFIGKDYTLQGDYSSSNASSWKYSASARLSYSISLKETHNISLIGRTAISSTQRKSKGDHVTALPQGVDGFPNYGEYYPDSHPDYTESVSRDASFQLVGTYNYLHRYLFDFTLSSDGATAFGRSNKFKTLWSTGIGWNVDKEEFAKNWTWMQALKLRASYGKNGNQNVSNISTNVYKFAQGSDVFGLAAYLSEYANANLKWQVVAKASAGMDITLLNNRLNATFDVYRTKTDPLVASIEQKPSTGLSAYPVNMGYMTSKGIEFSASYQVIRNIPQSIMLTLRVNGASGKVNYGGFEDALNEMNEAYKKEDRPNLNLNSLVQFRDGGSPSDLWAVRSLGIDPATGREVFLDRFGNPTFTYSADDRVVIASREPDLKGAFGFNFRYKEFTVNMNFAYSFGGHNFNQALFDKVENITREQIVHNQDKRALTERWQKPGDVTQFKNINITNIDRQSTPLSSRFIQRENYLAANDAKLSWDLTKKEWIKTAGLENLTISVSYRDLFYLSTMKRERGIDSPFSRSLSFGVSAQF